MRRQGGRSIWAGIHCAKRSVTSGYTPSLFTGLCREEEQTWGEGSSTEAGHYLYKGRKEVKNMR